MFANYGKVDEMEHQRLMSRRKTVMRVAATALAFILLVSIVAAVVAGTRSSRQQSDSKSSENLSSSIKAVCNVTLYPDSCFSSLSQVARTGRPLDLFRLSMQVAQKALQAASEQFGGPLWQNVDSNMTTQAVQNCKTLLGLATDHVNNSLLAASGDLSLIHSVTDLQTWLSTAATCQETCLDGFEFETQEIQSSVMDTLRNSTELTSNSLAIVNLVTRITSGSLNLRRRRLLTAEDEEPEWISAGARRLMASANLTSMANITVSKDGKGQFKTISDALNAVPSKSNQTFIIYVKKGVYAENVVVATNKWNVVMMGDGSNKTIVSGSLNVVDGTPTFSSATFAVMGKGFMARDMGFYNTAGAAKQQAVAFLSASDMSVFYQCRFDAFQDTLYTHSNRQFYRKCDILGTVDFIFGNAAVVFQNCNMLPRRPLPGQTNVITAQGKTDPNMNTGTSIQGCVVAPFEDLTGVKSYLGRPWKDYSTTIYMNSSLSSIVQPQGWLPWMGTTAPDTVFYAEYLNTGPGADTKNRVGWKGLKLNLTSKAAGAFTVKSFIQGDKWIPSTGVPYKGGL
uniref:Pectinesterase n=1 Tax=Kalanchoe fedtschenkoi TaxID=63787 RepID=A0A7N0THH6_KALFE